MPIFASYNGTDYSLSVNPEYPIECAIPDEAVLRNKEFEAGYVHTRPRFTKVNRTWTLKYRVASSADKAVLDSLLTAIGLGSSFTWTNPLDSASYTVRFNQLPKFSYVSYGLWDIEFTLEEA